MSSEKAFWPEAVGMKSSEAAQLIKAQNPNVVTEIHNIDEPLTMDFVETRVRILEDTNGIVAVEPQIG